jgi:hypothetical protein
MDKGVTCVVRLPIWSSSSSSWKVAAATDPANEVRELDVWLEVLGNDADGYHLVMTPDGCFTADYHYTSSAEAIEAARDIFGAPTDGWTAK